MMDIVHDVVAGSYNCFKLSIKAVAKEVEELFKNDRFILGGLVNTLRFTMPN